jgi:hypothetical protein
MFHHQRKLRHLKHQPHQHTPVSAKRMRFLDSRYNRNLDLSTKMLHQVTKRWLAKNYRQSMDTEVVTSLRPSLKVRRGFPMKRDDERVK